MKTNKKSHALGVGIFLLILFALFTGFVKMVDVQGIGPNDSLVGLATINGMVRDMIGTNDLCYLVTKLLGYLALLVAALFCLFGLIQWIGRRSLAKVDKELIFMYVFYVIVVGCYVLFEKFIINYRPVLEDGVLEASYPSSHTMLVFTIFGMAIAGRFGTVFGSKGPRIFFSWVFGILIVVMIAGRLLSGVHWVTDIIGGVLLSGAIVAFYKACINSCRKR